MLKPQDVVILSVIVLEGAKKWTVNSLAHRVHMSPSEVHASLVRTGASQLYNPRCKRVISTSFEEFLIHGLKYAFPPFRGTIIRGIPTAYAAPPLRNKLIISDLEPLPAWPWPQGETRGYEFLPIYKSVPSASIKDNDFYEFMALIDALTMGRARDSELAIMEIKLRLERGNDV